MTVKTVSFNHRSAHRMVAEQRALGNDVRWDNYDIVFFRPADHAMYSTAGAFKEGGYGFENRVEVNSEGKWEVDPRNLRARNRAGNGPRRK